MAPTTDNDTTITGARRPAIIAEPPLPRRTRRPLDGLRLLFVAVGITALIALAIIAERTLTGLTADLVALNRRIPTGPVGVVRFASELAGLVLPPVLVIIMLFRGRMRTTVELLLAAVGASAISALASTLLNDPAAEQIHDTFVPTAAGVGGTAVPSYAALLVAVVTVVARLNMPRVRQVAFFAIGGSFIVGLLQGEVTVGGFLIALGIGRIVGLLVRLISGQPSAAPTGQRVAKALKKGGIDVTSLTSLTHRTNEPRRFLAESSTHGYLDVHVLDRDNDGGGALARTIDRIRTRKEVLPSQTVTMRGAINQMTLQSLAVSRAGARTPKLRKVLRIGGDAAAVVYDHVPGTLLTDMSADDIHDDALEDLWRQLNRLRRYQVAHRRLSGHTILISPDNKAWLRDPSGGEVAAPDLAIRADLAQALVGVALIVGPERTVETALRVLKRSALAEAIPLLQPIALARATRQTLKEHPRLLHELRDGLVSRIGGEQTEPIPLRRFRPISLFTGIGVVAAVYLIGTQLSDVSFGQLWDQTDWRWLIAAVALMGVNYIAMAVGILGFVPEKMPFWRTVAAQVTSGFLRLAAPGAISVMTINARLLTKAGVAPPLAAASVAANQVGQVAITTPLIIILAVVSGSSAAAGLSPSPTTLVIVLGALLAAALLALIPPIRTRLRRLWEEFAGRGLPRLLDVLSTPRKLAMAVGGILAQSISLSLSFYMCIRAVGDNVNVAAVTVVQLVGNTLGMTIPTPGGLGGVEAALTAGATTIGASATAAVTAVIIFRLISFWMPIIPGWIIWTQMQRRNLL